MLDLSQLDMSRTTCRLDITIITGVGLWVSHVTKSHIRHVAMVSQPILTKTVPQM